MTHYDRDLREDLSVRRGGGGRGRPEANNAVVADAKGRRRPQRKIPGGRGGAKEAFGRGGPRRRRQGQKIRRRRLRAALSGALKGKSRGTGSAVLRLRPDSLLLRQGGSKFSRVCHRVRLGVVVEVGVHFPARELLHRLRVFVERRSGVAG